jgi:hypothetical protein
MKKEYRVKIVSKDEFVKILLKNLINDWTMVNTEDMFTGLLEEGLPKLNFDKLNECFPQYHVWLDDIVVDFESNMYLWLISGNRAMLVDKSNVATLK